jgi:hypothetical protein
VYYEPPGDPPQSRWKVGDIPADATDDKPNPAEFGEPEVEQFELNSRLIPEIRNATQNMVA